MAFQEPHANPEDEQDVLELSFSAKHTQFRSNRTNKGRGRGWGGFFIIFDKHWSLPTIWAPEPNMHFVILADLQANDATPRQRKWQRLVGPLAQLFPPDRFSL